MQHCEGTSAKWYVSRSFCLSPSSRLLQLVFFVSLSKCLLWQGFFSPISSIPSIQVLQLTKPPFIAAQRQLCTSLCHACFPVSLMSWQSVDRRASTFPPRPSSPLSDCNNVSKCSSAWRWMGSLFSTTCHLSNPQLVTGGGKTQSCKLRCLWWEEGGAACWASETAFLWFNLTYSDETIHTCCVSYTVRRCLMRSHMPAYFAEAWSLKKIVCCIFETLAAIRCEFMFHSKWLPLSIFVQFIPLCITGKLVNQWENKKLFSFICVLTEKQKSGPQMWIFFILV